MIKTKIIINAMCFHLDSTNTVQYYLKPNLLLNKHLKKFIEIKFLDNIICINCKNNIRKSFNHGYCYYCFKKLARCDICIVKPELCHYQYGTCREKSWGQKNCLVPHIVYLSNTNDVKVGITRKSNRINRWINQGAIQAISIIEVNDRLLSGQIEVILKKYISDKTYWKKMLQNSKIIDLKNYRDSLLKQVENVLSTKINFIKEDISFFKYPIVREVENVTSLNFNTENSIRGHLIGVKGQYLILDNGVFNVRKFSGHYCEINIS